MSKELIVFKDPKSPISEIFRTLRTNIQFMNTRSKLKTILITSTLPGEGKSWVSSNLAITFAQAGKKVILVDADMRKGRQYKIFEATPMPGLSNYLSGISDNSGKSFSKDLADYIQETKVPNLYLIPAGNIPPNPSELLISEQMVNLLKQLKQISDIVIIDGLPSLLVADSLILTRIVDSTIIVTACKQTKKDDLRQVINSIKHVGGKVSGVVLNKIPISAKEYEKSYYYGSESLKGSRRKNFNEMANSVSVGRNDRMPNNPKRNIPQQYNQMKMNNNIRKTGPGPVRQQIPPNRPNNTIKSNNLQNKTFQPAQNLSNKKINVENKTGTVSIEKTNDILKQVNEYLEQEKKNLKT